MRKNEYLKWIESFTINPEIKKQLFLMSESEKEDAFSQKIEFGTAGIRGKIGPGSNRINHYVVAKTTLGFIQYLKKKHYDINDSGVCIAYDNRKFSQDFAALVANLLAKENIKAYIFEDLRPTPQLSYMIKYMNCAAGINITASHNPKEYNGYKVYDANGCQILPDEISKIVYEIDQIKNELEIDIDNFGSNNQLIHFLDSKDDRPFVDAAVECMINKELDVRNHGIVYTPLHGAGGPIIPKALQQAGFTHIFQVPAQMDADPNFSTAPEPNPEDIKAFALGIEKANQLNVDYVIATDPDCDRVGVCVRRKNGEFKLLSGNELGAILLEYILSYRYKQNKLEDNSVMIDTIVTSDLGKEVAYKYNLTNISVLTGFKYIGSLIEEYSKSHEYKFEFGYEESLGFLSNPYVQDKDAVSTTIIIAEMINHYGTLEKSLLDALVDIYHEHGFYQNKQVSINLDPLKSKDQVQLIMSFFRNGELESIINQKITKIYDFEFKEIIENGKVVSSTNLPETNAIKIALEDGSWLAIRPSGTEPKLKFYLASKADTILKAKDKIQKMNIFINETLESLY
ncbi:phospho-sugar mutase [Mycoplasma sp. P36-A1]|uniref:phospho-sugar mutase n=1 Tax=Mycoplasma sp. P36-A1 TaxID=3252900 RepID=UPI003C2BEC5A